jgi:hypothetical protein
VARSACGCFYCIDELVRFLLNPDYALEKYSKNLHKMAQKNQRIFTTDEHRFTKINARLTDVYRFSHLHLFVFISRLSVLICGKKLYFSSIADSGLKESDILIHKTLHCRVWF